MPDATKVPARVICGDCGTIVKVDMKALAAKKADKIRGKHKDDNQKTARCPNCKGVAYRTIGSKFVGDAL